MTIQGGYAPKRGDDPFSAHAPVPKHGFGPRKGDDFPLSEFVPAGKFGRMFPELLPFTPPLAAIDELGAAMIDNGPASENANVPAGFTYLGQFVDHDVTFDPTALQEIIVDPLALQNFRTPMLDLDCLYGAGPAANPQLYQRGANDLFLIGTTSASPGGGDPSIPVSMPNDLPRAPHGFALIGDPRNDENLVVAQLHLAMLKFHNKIVAGLKDGQIKPESPIRKDIFTEARDLAIWHYQWIVLHDFLARVLDKTVLDAVLKRDTVFPRFAKGAFIPVEFSAAAYRFGHSMIREVYSYNRVFTPGGVAPATLGLLFRFSGLSGTGADVPIPSDWIIDWNRFFETSGAKPNPARRFDARLAPALQNLPNVPAPNSLAARNLRRGRSLGLPPGQSVARFFGYKRLTRAEIGQGADGAVAKKHGFDVESPLWYYILKEAEVHEKGLRLGKVGSRIVAEVFYALLKHDNSSFVARKPDWVPTLPGKKAGEFTFADLLLFVNDLSPIGP